jgi:hypothetical protein
MGAVGAFAVIGLFVAIIGLFMMLGANGTMNNIKTEHAYFQSMITRAENPADTSHEVRYISELGEFFRESANSNKWWFRYRVQGVSYLSWEWDYSLPIYTEAEKTTIVLPIQVAFNIASEDSVPMDAISRSRTYTDDGGYIDAQNTHRIASFMLYGGGGLFVLLILAEVGLFAGLRKRGAAAQEAEQAAATAATAQAKEAASRCPYCSAKIEPGDRNCTNCGGNL